MAKRSKEDRIKAALHAHEKYKRGWARRDSFMFSYISPRGKCCTFHEYDTAINKHLNKTVKKILAIAHDETVLKVN